MNGSFRFLSGIALLMLLALAAQSTTTAPRCDVNGGTCVPWDSCHGHAENLHCDDENDICCVYDVRSETNRSNYDCGGILPPELCRVGYDGVCLSKCESGRVPVGFCNKDCKCCGCPISNKCEANSGYCTPRDCKCRGVKVSTWCGGKRCTCCLPDCPESEKCKAKQGKCRKTCPDGEKPMPGVNCLGGCKCCVPKCPESEKCKANQGQCRKTCPGGEVPMPGVECLGGYKCCVPSNCTQIPIPEECKLYDGVCHRECRDGRIPTGVCRGDCKCCGCPIKDECKKRSGVCVASPDVCYGEIVPEWCGGERCVCCLPGLVDCPKSEKCKANQGQCRKTCPVGEEPMPGVECLGGCKCCVPSNCTKIPIPEVCKLYDGVCHRECRDGRIPTGVCRGDCKCCGCPIKDECKIRKGVCVASPNVCNGEIVPEWCGGEKCVCCLPDSGK
ncbi:balbiani ring protein 3-like [Macrobrachium nipponense]|uniref:balbiani ring protein 3-like n=1 Tax=Macrobrachium nipponense TaxID=159736 RepID=UPI0030C83EB6